MNERNRAEGWKHAKISGHENELLAENAIKNDIYYQQNFLNRLNIFNRKINSIFTGGLNEKNVPCIFNKETTKSKTDMYIELDNGFNLKISIKKSLSGQVFLIGIDRFIDGFEFQYNKKIPDNVKRAIKLFWGAAHDISSILNTYSYNKDYELRKNRLVAYTLQSYDKSLYESLLLWFVENIYEITDFCFSKGLACQESDWANVIWYINELGENSIDYVFYINDLCRAAMFEAQSMIYYGNRGGGTTIQLPFGFVQWHSPTKKIPGDIQFHHTFDKIFEIMNNK